MSRRQTEIPAGIVAKERYKLCSSCGNFVGYMEPAVYCVVCGTAFVDACPRCREPIIYPIARYCPACGEGLVHGKDGERQAAF